MSICESCDIADKIYECCGRFPDTSESVDFLLENNFHVSACPHLTPHGRCQIYTQRPLNCRMHTCQIDLTALVPSPHHHHKVP